MCEQNTKFHSKYRQEHDAEETKKEQQQDAETYDPNMIVPTTTFMHPVTPFQEKHMVESLDV